MLKFDIRKQPRIRGLNEKLVNKLVEEANEVREAYYNDEISGTDYIREILDVQQVLFAIYGTYAESNIFNIFERNMKAHNDKLATSHKNKYGLGGIQYHGYVAVTKPREGLVADLEKEIKYLRDIVAQKDIDMKKLRNENNIFKSETQEKLAELEERNRELTRDKLQLELLLKEGKPKELAEKEEEINKLKEEVNQLRIENGEYRDIIGRIENYLQELKRQ